MTTDVVLVASALSAVPSVGVGLIVALIDPDEGHPVVVTLVVFVLMAASMVQVLAA